jgi:hypothetical protein
MTLTTAGVCFSGKPTLFELTAPCRSQGQLECQTFRGKNHPAMLALSFPLRLCFNKAGPTSRGFCLCVQQDTTKSARMPTKLDDVIVRWRESCLSAHGFLLSLAHQQRVSHGPPVAYR